MSIRMRHTRAHTGNRRSHHRLKQSPLTQDKESGVTHMRHRASLETGSYRGHQVIDVAKQAEKKLKKQKAKENEQQA